MSKTEQNEVVGKLTDTGGAEYEFDEAQEGKETSRAAQDSLVSLYRHHPECVLDYAETVLAKLPLRVAPVSGDTTEDP
jgi:hypothetical protein